MGQLLPFRQDVHNGGSRGQCRTAARRWKRTGGPLCESVASSGAVESQDSHPSGRACSGVILISIKGAGSAR